MLLFEKYPKIVYDGHNAINIMTRAAIRKQVLNKFTVFYDYTVTDGERPDTIAYDYYDDAAFDWLVLMSNSIIDVYSQWPKSYQMFLNYLQSKYGYVNSLMSEIHHYKFTGDNALRTTYVISPETYEGLDNLSRVGWVPVYTYDWESDLNDAKRNIKLISNEYTSQIKKELTVLYS